MIFGGIQKLSLIDFPGKVSAVVFAAGCDFSCPYCHNPELVTVKSAQTLDEDEVLAFLEKRKVMLDGVVVTGGEPTLQPGLLDFLRKIRKMGYKVKLDTNGGHPQALVQVLRAKLVDYVAMDIKTAPRLYPELVCESVTQEVIEDSIRVIMESGVDYEFRTTCAPGFVDPALVEEMARALDGAKLWIFQKMATTKMLRPEFFKNLPPVPDPAAMARFSAQAAAHVRRASIR
ncbi:MAG: anaerobic ribonucleoside-triphosphate reductase activating protein [Deltaproteobacteria bacterium]|nr:anaerobic ribonucleoside-triphosphate reductase activating protein [Deltaproteobacteria bacterium]